MNRTQQLLEDTRRARLALVKATSEEKNQALTAMAAALEENMSQILEQNQLDLQAAQGQIGAVMQDRLRLTETRIHQMAEGIRQLVQLEDPVGKVLETVRRPNGLLIQKKTVPMGVIAIIYESRPNVTSDAAALALKSGSACVLRGGKEAIQTNRAIVKALQQGLKTVGLPVELIGLVEDTSRESATQLMQAVGLVDLLIPRGGPGLIRACVEQAKVPCIQTGTGICHIYVDKDADLSMALDILNNAKTSRPSVCNAAEVCLVHKDIAAEFLPRMEQVLVEQPRQEGKPSVELRLDEQSARYIPGTPATPADFDTEFCDYILAVAVVDGVEQAVEHIRAHSTGHSEAIITANQQTADAFVQGVDSAAVYVNASTRFTDGEEFGMGCEMGISTQKLHARGPMGLAELVSYQYIIQGSGQVR